MTRRIMPKKFGAKQQVVTQSVEDFTPAVLEKVSVLLAHPVIAASVWCHQDPGSSTKMCGGCEFRYHARVQESPGVWVETNEWRCQAQIRQSVQLEVLLPGDEWRCSAKPTVN